MKDHSHFTRYYLGQLLLFIVLVSMPLLAFAQEQSVASVSPDIEQADEVANFRPTQDYFLAKVTAITKEESRDFAGQKQQVQSVRARFTSGKDKGKEVVLADHIVLRKEQKVSVGETVVVIKQQGYEQELFYIADKYRLYPFIFILGLFLVLGVVFARSKGIMAVAGLLLSLLILVKFVVPQILAGNNPVLIGLIGAVVIAVLSLYVAHGFNRRITIALGATLITLVLASLLAWLFVSLAKLSGLGSEEAAFLQLSPAGDLNLKGLLLAGIIIGVLGVLDDVTTSQVATVDEIRRANPSLSFHELYSRGLSVGREHIASLINTLVLAYAGASFPLFLLFSLNTQQPLWAVLNSEFVAEEVVRTLVGSTALILAVPIATFLAAHFLSGSPVSDESDHHHSH